MKITVKRLVLLTIVMSMFFSLLTFTVTAVEMDSNSETWSEADCIYIKEYIEDNFSTFVDEYNKAYPDDIFTATSIEYWSIINLVEDNNVGLYLDFNGNNGYYVGTGDYTIYELQTVGDLSELKNQTEIWFSYADGFLHKGEEGFVRLSSVLGDSDYNIHRDQIVASTQEFDLQSDTVMYEGSLGGGYIAHDSIEQYVAKAYPEYEYSERANYVTSFIGDPKTQEELRYYMALETDATGNEMTNRVYQEGNCSLVAMYHALKCWSFVSGATNIDYASVVDIEANITSDPHYAQYGSGALYHNPSYVYNSSDTYGLENFEYYRWYFCNYKSFDDTPVLYTQIRNHAITQGYLPYGGYGMDGIEKTLEYVAGLYSHDIDVATTPMEVMTTDSFQQAKNSIDHCKAVVMGINNSTVNEKHAVCLTGYYEYKHTTGFLLWEKTTYYYFLEIVSGNSNNSIRYYDPYIYSSGLRYAYWG